MSNGVEHRVCPNRGNSRGKSDESRSFILLFLFSPIYGREECAISTSKSSMDQKGNIVRDFE